MNILITGATSGMGQAIVRSLDDGHNHMFLQYASKEKKKDLDTLAKEVRSSTEFIQADLTLEKDLERLSILLNKCEIDVLVHSVSFPTTLGSIAEKSWVDFEKHLSLQVKSLLALTHACISNMQTKKFGRIVAIATEYTVGKPPVKLSDYVTAKYALVGLMKSLAVELGKWNITANCVSPGMADTQLTSHLPNKLKEIVASQTPTQRLTTPQDVAQLVRFLCSTESAQITGENFLVTGGYVMD